MKKVQCVVFFMRALVIKEDFFVCELEKVHFIDFTMRLLSSEWTFLWLSLNEKYNVRNFSCAHKWSKRTFFHLNWKKVHLIDFSTGVPSSEWTFCLSINEKVQCRDFLMCALVVVWCSVLFNVKLMIIYDKYLHCRYPNLLC